MDILNHLDSESSGDSDGNVMEDHVIVEDGNYSGSQTDLVTKNSTLTICIESDSSRRSGNSS